MLNRHKGCSIEADLLKYSAVLIDSFKHFCAACSSHLQWRNIPRRRCDREAVQKLR